MQSTTNSSMASNSSLASNSSISINATFMPPIMGNMAPPYPPELMAYFQKERGYRITLSILYLAVGIFGNVLAIFILLKRKMEGRMNIYEKILLSMAVNDILSLLANCWFSNLFALENGYAIGWFACKIVFPIVDCFSFVSSLSLLLISYVRRRAIITPMAEKITGKKLLVIIACIWLLALISVMIMPIIYTRVIDVGLIRPVCVYQPPLHVRNTVVCVHLTMLLFIPTFVMWLFYWQIRDKLFESLKVLSEAPSRVLEQRRRDNIQATKMIITVSMVFSVTNILYFIAVFINMLHEKVVRTALWFYIYHDVTYYIILLNNVINCFIYCVFMRSYRKIVMSMFTCILPFLPCCSLGDSKSNEGKDPKNKTGNGETRTGGKTNKSFNSTTTTSTVAMDQVSTTAKQEKEEKMSQLPNAI